MARTEQEKLERKQQLEEKREARRLAKEKKDKEKAEADAKTNPTKPTDALSDIQAKNGENYIFTLSDDTLNHVLWFLPAREMGALMLTCRHFSKLLVEARVSFLISRLHRPNDKIKGAIGFVDMCSNQVEAR